MIDYAESFQEFSSKLSSTDLALYAGAGLIIWVLFKDRLSPVTDFIKDTVSKIKGSSVVPNVIVPEVKPVVVDSKSKEDLFFKLIVSWKQTRDLAVQCDCSEAIKVADQMFPYLSPQVCSKQEG